MFPRSPCVFHTYAVKNGVCGGQHVLHRSRCYETLDEALVADADGDDLVDEETHADDDLVVDTHATARATN